MMDWFVVVRGKPYKGTLREHLTAAGVEFYIPTVTVERFAVDRMEEKEQLVINSLVFIRTSQPIDKLVEFVDGLRYPYYDHITRAPAKVPDRDLERFRRILALRSVHAQFLEDPFTKFANRPKVRVKAGEFEGMEGYVLRVKRDRKVVVSLGNTAVAISGIHPTLLELV